MRLQNGDYKVEIRRRLQNGDSNKITRWRFEGDYRTEILTRLQEGDSKTDNLDSQREDHQPNKGSGLSQS